MTSSSEDRVHVRFDQTGGRMDGKAEELHRVDDRRRLLRVLQRPQQVENQLSHGVRDDTRNGAGETPDDGENGLLESRTSRRGAPSAERTRFQTISHHPSPAPPESSRDRSARSSEFSRQERTLASRSERPTEMSFCTSWYSCWKDALCFADAFCGSSSYVRTRLWIPPCRPPARPFLGWSRRSRPRRSSRSASRS